MNQVETAALMLAAVTLAFVALALAIWWRRRPRAAPAAPRAPRDARLPKLSFKTKPDTETAPVEISASRLARISGKTVTDPTAAPADEPSIDPLPAAADAAHMIEAELEARAAAVEEQAHRADAVETVSVRLVPQIPPRDAILTSSWLGGRPRLPAGMDWPLIDGEPADFLAQVDCTQLPPDLWGGVGPRHGSLAFFIHRRGYRMRVLHLHDADIPVPPPRALDDPDGWLGPHGAMRFGDLDPFAIRAFPEWPVDVVAVSPDGVDPRFESADDAITALYDRGYDIADPAFHPFDWGSMTAMLAVLEMRLDRLTTDATPPPGASAADIVAYEQRADANREARARAEEIIAIVRESAVREAFSATDTTAVMAALHAIRWVKAVHRLDPDTGAETHEMVTLPLTTHRADAPLWVHDYQTILFDRAKHAWCANPDSLSAPMRAFYEPWWQELAAREMAAMGHEPFRYIHDFDEDRDAVLIELPTSGLMSRLFGDNDHLVVTIDKADLTIGDFTKLRVQVSS
ncbi:MAG: DUF1963 domain-containing protein [Sphingopyxis solisilvae]|uniref:DUF1963 domain-containing protein n=1 Tax=Sphingopyxis solisilvae TaxID=1886788 RepID=UPI00403731AB